MRIGVLESQCLTGLGECDKAFETAQSVAEEGEKLPEFKTTVIDALLEMAAASDRLFQIDMLFEACERAEHLRTTIPTDDESLLESIRANILHHKSFGFSNRGEFGRATECALESLTIRERLGNMPDIVSSLLRVAQLRINVDRSQTLDYLEKAQKLNVDLDRKRYNIQGLMLRAWIDRWEGNLDDAEEGFRQCIDLARQYDMGYFLVPALRSIAGVYAAMGDSRRAEKSYKECLTLSEKTGAGLFIAICSNNLGEIHRFRGDFDKALKGYERAMKINKSMGRMAGYITALLDYGLIQYAMGDLEEALRHVEEALAIAREQKDSRMLDVGACTWYAVVIMMDMGMVSKAQQHVEYLCQVMNEDAKDSIREFVDQLYRVSAAIVLKSSPVARNRTLARDHLTQVVEGKLIDYEVTSMAYLLFCDLLVEDLQLSGDRGLLDELKSLLTDFTETVVEQGKTSLHVEALLLQSKVALIELEAEEANRLLNLARYLADEGGFEKMAKLIVDEQDALLREWTIWDELGETKPAMTERAERVRIHEQIGNMIQQGSWRKMLY